MNIITPSIQDFFTEFNRASAALDIPVILSEFEEQFMYASPKGTQVIKSEQFAAVVGKQKELFDSFGLESTRTSPVEEQTLDEFYTLVRAEVTMAFEKDGKSGHILQKVAYILSMREKPRICFYSNPNDVMKLLDEAGLT
jgi:hypothetical protein